TAAHPEHRLQRLRFSLNSSSVPVALGYAHARADMRREESGHERRARKRTARRRPSQAERQRYGPARRRLAAAHRPLSRRALAGRMPQHSLRDRGRIRLLAQPRRVESQSRFRRSSQEEVTLFRLWRAKKKAVPKGAALSAQSYTWRPMGSQRVPPSSWGGPCNE